MDYEKTLKAIRQFSEERDWRQYHNPKDLAMALSIEVSELQEIFLWKNSKEMEEVVHKKRLEIEQEIADVAVYLFELVDVLGIPLEEAILAKLEHNRAKYPVESAKGKNLKYNEL